MTGKTAKVYLTGEEQPLLNVKIVKPNKAVEVQGELTPASLLISKSVLII